MKPSSYHALKKLSQRRIKLPRWFTLGMFTWNMCMESAEVKTSWMKRPSLASQSDKGRAAANPMATRRFEQNQPIRAQLAALMQLSCNNSLVSPG